MADVHELLDTWIANVKDEELLAELNTMKEQGDEDASPTLSSKISPSVPPVYVALSVQALTV